MVEEAGRRQSGNFRRSQTSRYGKIPFMPSDFAQVQEIARSSLMADFFAVRIDEEKLFDTLKLLNAGIKLSRPVPPIDKIKQACAAAPTAAAFIEAIKKENLFPTLREVLTKIKVPPQ